MMVVVKIYLFHADLRHTIAEDDLELLGLCVCWVGTELDLFFYRVLNSGIRPICNGLYLLSHLDSPKMLLLNG